MYPFFETILIKNGIIQNLSLHQKRVDKTFLSFYPFYAPLPLQKILSTYNTPLNSIIKCKVLYSNLNYKIQLHPYLPIKHTKFKLIEKPNFNYAFKYSDRFFFNELKLLHPNYECIITKNNTITDTTYANLIFKKNNQWFTPKTTLLNGTQRQYLLSKSIIAELNITVNNLSEFSAFKQINAMLTLTNSEEYSINRIV